MAVDLKNLIDINLLSYFKSKLDLLFANKVDKEAGKGLSSNDYTSEEKTKLAGVATGAQVNTLEGIQVAGTTINPVNKIANIPAATTSASGAMSAADKTKLDGIATGAQVNVIESVKRNGTELAITGKAVDISVPTTVAELTDANDYATKVYVDTNGGKIDKIKVNGVEQVIDSTDKSVNLSVVDSDTMFPTLIPLELMDGYLSFSVSVQPTPPFYGGTSLTLGDLRNRFMTGLDLEFWLPEIDLIAEGSENNWVAFKAVKWAPDGSAVTIAATLNDVLYWADLRPVSTSSMNGLLQHKGLSTEDYTTAEKTKLSGVESGAQVNVVTNASSSGSGVAQTMTVSKGATNYTTYTKDALDTSLGLKANASSVYTKTEIDQKLVGAMNYKGTKATTSALPSSGNAQGDVWHITADGSEWAWNGTTWEELGTALDLSGYVEDDDLGLATTEDIDALFT